MVEKMSKITLDELCLKSIFSLISMRLYGQVRTSTSWKPTAKEELPCSRWQEVLMTCIIQQLTC